MRVRTIHDDEIKGYFSGIDALVNEGWNFLCETIFMFYDFHGGFDKS
jgi:hypothetical protein